MLRYLEELNTDFSTLLASYYLFKRINKQRCFNLCVTFPYRWMGQKGREIGVSPTKYCKPICGNMRIVMGIPAVSQELHSYNKPRGCSSHLCSVKPPTYVKLKCNCLFGTALAQCGRGMLLKNLDIISHAFLRNTDMETNLRIGLLVIRGKTFFR